jgi:hypothetical protein
LKPLEGCTEGVEGGREAEASGQGTSMALLALDMEVECEESVDAER